MTQDRAEYDMDLEPDFEHTWHIPPTPPSPLSNLQEPMDTNPDCQGHMPVNANHLPQTQPDYPNKSNISLVGRINQDLDEDIVVDDVVSPVVSPPDSPVQPSRTGLAWVKKSMKAIPQQCTKEQATPFWYKASISQSPTLSTGVRQTSAECPPNVRWTMTGLLLTFV